MKLDNETISLLAFFENLTRSRVKDCFFDRDKVVFIVEKGEMSKAIGKYGSNVKKMEYFSKKKIKIVEFNKDVKIFLKNYLFPIEVQEIMEKEGSIEMHINGMRERGLVIGRDRMNVENLQKIASKYFKIKDIKVM